MRRLVVPLALAAAFAAAPASAVGGSPDRVPGASLLVPFFETGVNVATHQNDTLLVVQHTSGAPATIHWTIWTIDGTAVPAASGSATIAPAATWSVALRDVIGRAGAAAQDALRQGPYWRGFVTVDLVTQATSLNPFAPAYPFADANILEGYVYFVGDGDANGLTMIPLERLTDDAHPFLRGFYAANEGRGGRERLDSTARRCGSRLANLASAEDCLEDANGVVDRIHARAFQVPALGGISRFVVFAWNTFRPVQGGPSRICEEEPDADCETEYRFVIYGPDGAPTEDAMVRLDHVVNVFDLDGEDGELISLWNVPNVDGATQVFALSFNRALPPGRTVTWVAVFEAFVLP